MELMNGLDTTAGARNLLGFVPRELQPLCIIRHSITRYRITVEVFAARGNRESALRRLSGRWFSMSELNKLPFPSAHGRILNIISSKR